MENGKWTREMTLRDSVEVLKFPVAEVPGKSVMREGLIAAWQLNASKVINTEVFQIKY